MVSRLLPLVLFAFLAAPAAASPGPAADSQGQASPVRSERVKNGISHFDRAFYGSIPHKRDAEAAREFDLAVTEFEAELRANPDSLDAHRYLARICAARRQFRQAAAHYDAIGRIDPPDVDACVLAALAWLDAGDPGEARARLLDAKTRTTDEAVLARLDEYLARLDRAHPLESK